MTTRLPVLFVGHGSPMNAIADNSYTRSLADIGSVMPKPAAIMVVSAHWLTEGTFVACGGNPRTIHDFYGFPRELYELRYPCPGSPAHARLVTENVTGTTVGCHDSRGIDHAAWAVLRHIYPAANIPVFEMSLDIQKPPEYHYALAQQLTPLRDMGILIVGSGNIVHNLMVANFDSPDAPAFPWALRFDRHIGDCLLNRDHTRLINYNTLPCADLAVPTNDHYLPMLYAAALHQAKEPISFIHTGIQNASVSMRCFMIGQ